MLQPAARAPASSIVSSRFCYSDMFDLLIFTETGYARFHARNQPILSTIFSIRCCQNHSASHGVFQHGFLDCEHYTALSTSAGCSTRTKSSSFTMSANVLQRPQTLFLMSTRISHIVATFAARATRWHTTHYFACTYYTGGHSVLFNPL